MHRTSKFYRWRQRFLDLNPFLKKYEGHPRFGNEELVSSAWDHYNGREVSQGMLFELMHTTQVSGKEFRE